MSFPITIISGLSEQIIARQITLFVGRKILRELMPSVNRNAPKARNIPPIASDPTPSNILQLKGDFRYTPRIHECIRDAHARLDDALRAAYGMADDVDPLALLLELNLERAARENAARRSCRLVCPCRRMSRISL